MLNDIAIAIVPRDGRVCLCTRINKQLQLPVIHDIDGDAAAAAALAIEECVRHRHDAPVLYVPDDAPTVIDAIQVNKNDVAPVALSSKPISGRFYDRWSEIVFDFTERTTNSGKLLLPEDDGLVAELDAFGQIPGTRGSTRFADPLTTEVNLGYFPLKGVATVLASLPGNVRNAHTDILGHDPMAGDLGHDPMAY